jgi:hypothetical protein
MYPDVPQSDEELQAIVWLTQAPAEHVWFDEQSVINWFEVEVEQAEVEVPGLEHVYVLYVLYTSPF